MDKYKKAKKQLLLSIALFLVMIIVVFIVDLIMDSIIIDFSVATGNLINSIYAYLFLIPLSLIVISVGDMIKYSSRVEYKSISNILKFAGIMWICIGFLRILWYICNL